MKRIVFILVGILAISVLMPSSANAQKKEKKKKEKKEWSWEMPEKLSGNDEIDNYLQTCDTINGQIRTFADSIVYYHVAKRPLVNDKNEPELDETGMQKYAFYVVDDNDNIRSPKMALSQYGSMINAGMQIITSMTKLTSRTLSATKALPSLGLDALKYAKYVKAGPKLISVGGAEIKRILKECSAQRKVIRAFKKGYFDAEEQNNATADVSKLAGVDISEIPDISKSSAEIEKEIALAAAEDAKYSGRDADDDIEIDLDVI